MRIRWPWRKRYAVVIVGTESGSRTTLTFATFRRREKAEAFAARGNERAGWSTPWPVLGDRTLLTRYEVEDLG